jgi:hypothetical protein
MDDLFTEGMCFDSSTEGERGTPPEGPPLSTKLSAGWHGGMGTGQSEGPEPQEMAL